MAANNLGRSMVVMMMMMMDSTNIHLYKQIKDTKIQSQQYRGAIVEMSDRDRQFDWTKMQRNSEIDEEQRKQKLLVIKTYPSLAPLSSSFTSKL